MSFVYRWVFVTGITVWCFSTPVWAQGEKEQAPEPQQTVQERIDHDLASLQDCYARGCGLIFKCNPQWRVRVVDDYSSIITISTDPFVTLAISRIDTKIKLLGQLTRSFFQEKQIYLDNFREEYVSFGGDQAIELKAFSKFEPRMRYLGYFYINDDGLNSVFFAVYPKEHWDDYKFFIRKLAASFQRI